MKTFLGFDNEIIEINVHPKDVQNYEKKLENTKTKFGNRLSHNTCELLVLLSEEVSQNLPKKPKKLLSYFITINAKKDIDFLLLKKCIEKAVEKKFIEHVIYCYEQRSEDPKIFQGYHCHMLITSNKKKYKHDLIREFHNSCKKICTQNAVNVKYVRSRDDYQRIFSYMKGNKIEEKQAKLKVDVLFRNKYSLEEYYEK